MIAPATIGPLRTKGDKLIVPDDIAAAQAMGRVVGSFKFCLDAGGRVTDVSRVRSTGLPDYDAKIERSIRRWEYRPFAIDGRPSPVCSYVTFIFR